MSENFITKSGKEVFIRPIENTESDVKAALDFINKIIEEDAMIKRSGDPATLEEEKEWVENTTKKVSQGDEIFLAAFLGEREVGATEITRQGGRSKHVGTFGITIAKELRGEGLGRELMRQILQEASKIGLTHIELHVYEKNEPAIKLYTSLGFKEVGRRPEAIAYQGKLITDIIMWLSLEEASGKRP
ncbi:MAG: GNAT family N-acetyltransferase [Nanoarchaeota archaeon]|nr:GNAT family N-acetyltransferase [Nanoarchaeota archaeon]